VRSYRTISPLPAEAGGMFLLHFPSARAAQGLPGTLPDGVRTFLYETSSQRLPGPLNVRMVAERRPCAGSQLKTNASAEMCRIVATGGLR
jgi:hypothetical protein